MCENVRVQSHAFDFSRITAFGVFLQNPQKTLDAIVFWFDICALISWVGNVDCISFNCIGELIFKVSIDNLTYKFGIGELIS